MALEKIEQHVESGLLRLPPKLWGKPRVGAGLASLLREIQTLEDAIWAQFEAQHIDTAERPALLVLAKLIGQQPEAFSEEGLRTAIKARALANRSRGTGPEVGRVLRAIFGEGNFSWVWVDPAIIYVTALDPLADEDVAIAESVLPYATGAGVQLQLLYAESGSFMIWGSGFWGEAWPTVRAI